MKQRNNAREGFGGELHIKINRCRGVGGALLRGNQIKLLIRQLDQARRQRKRPVHLRGKLPGVAAAFIPDVVFEFGPGVLQHGADLHLEFPPRIRLKHRGDPGRGHPQNEMMRAVTKRTRHAGLGGLIHATPYLKHLGEGLNDAGNLGGMVGGHPHPYEIVNILPRVRIHEHAIGSAFPGLAAQGSPFLHPGGDMIIGEAGVGKHVFDGT